MKTISKLSEVPIEHISEAVLWVAERNLDFSTFALMKHNPEMTEAVAEVVQTYSEKLPDRDDLILKTLGTLPDSLKSMAERAGFRIIRDFMNDVRDVLSAITLIDHSL